MDSRTVRAYKRLNGGILYSCRVPPPRTQEISMDTLAKLALDNALENFADDKTLYDSRLAFRATMVDPAEYVDICLLCEMQEREHYDNCPVTKILQFGGTL